MQQFYHHWHQYALLPQVPVSHYGPVGEHAVHCGAAFWVGAFNISLILYQHRVFESRRLLGHRVLVPLAKMISLYFCAALQEICSLKCLWVTHLHTPTDIHKSQDYLFEMHAGLRNWFNASSCVSHDLLKCVIFKSIHVDFGDANKTRLVYSVRKRHMSTSSQCWHGQARQMSLHNPPVG